MSGAGPAASDVVLHGRRDECKALDRLLDGARAGQSGVLVLSGEPGVGKTALLEYAIRSASDLTVLRAAGVQSEMELAFAALHQLCVPLLDSLDRLPGPQRDALLTTFGLDAGAVPDRFLVALATLGLLSDAAHERPLLGVVDDAQWLDHVSAETLTFIARRLRAESVVMLFATREPSDEMAGLPVLMLQGLDDDDARELLGSVVPGRLDERVATQLVAETHGNPLALLELPRGLTLGQLAGGFGLATALPLSNRLEQRFTRLLVRLPRDARRLLLLAAAEPVGDPALLWRAAQQLGIPETAGQAVESAGLLILDRAVVFRHPLVRSAVYGAADPNERREVHRALADATDPQIDPDRRAWHRAQGSSVPDEDVAAELERSASRAQGRGGFAAAAAFLESAAILTPAPARRAERSLAAAETKFRAGALNDARTLLSLTEVAALDELDQARAELLRAQIAFFSTHGRDASTMLLEAAHRLTPLSPALACETYLETLSATIFAGRLAAPGGSVVDVSLAAKTAPRPPVLRGQDLLLEGYASLFTEGYETAVPILRRAQDAFLGSALPVGEQLRWQWLVAISYELLWDDVRWEAIAERHVQMARETGALAELTLALSMRVFVHLFAGELTTAASLVEEIQAANEAARLNLTPYGAVGLVALRGREAEAAARIADSRADVTGRGEGIGLTVLDWAEAALYNGLGRYEAAGAAAFRINDHPTDLRAWNLWMPELIEAAARAGTPELAANTRAQLVGMARVTGTNWALGLAARCEALFAEDEQAETLYVEAVNRLGRCRMAVDLARAHLLYGEWLRRRRRRLDARQQLRTAHELFGKFGTEAFGDRAARELLATGEHPRQRTVQTRNDLTPQEAQIARLARDGLSNAEIGARLFLSRHTVDYHLRKVFAKLGISSRSKLAEVLPPEPVAALIA